MKQFVFGFVLLGACATDPTAPGPTDPHVPRGPQVDVRLTDAPGDFESVWVDIARVEIESETGWTALVEEPQRFDLLTLQNDVTAALGGAALEPGMYGQLRMIVDSASVVVDGEESSLAIASGSQTGIKISLDQMFETDTTYTITLDFDAAKSVKATGHGYLMTPVVSVKAITAAPAEPPPTDEEPAPTPE